MPCGSRREKRPYRAYESPPIDSQYLEETGRLQWFYHSPDSCLPVRDVLNRHGQGYKTEPYLEKSAENYCITCYQPNIRGFLNSNEKYLFLFTRRSDSAGDRERYVVGYLVKENCLLRARDHEGEIKQFLAVQGPIKLVSFDDAYPLKNLVATRIRGYKRLSKKQTAQLLNHFRKKKNVFNACLEELERLKKSPELPKGKGRCESFSYA